jgi:hypothetical protein
MHFDDIHLGKKRRKPENLPQSGSLQNIELRIAPPLSKKAIKKEE